MVELNQLEDGQERVEKECTRDGSIDWHGKPALKGKTGGWRCGTLLLGTYFPYNFKCHIHNNLIVCSFYQFNCFSKLGFVIVLYRVCYFPSQHKVCMISSAL